jgi:hypothetical protein
MAAPKRTKRSKAPSPPANRPGARRKNLWISQPKLDMAKKELGAATETEAIDRALDLVVFQREVRQGLEAMAGRGGFVNHVEL